MTRKEKIAKAMWHINEAAQIILGLESAESKQENNKLVDYASVAIGSDVSPKDVVPDELGCAESVSNLLRAVLNDFPIITGTWTLWDRFENDPRFDAVTEPRAGDIIISPTGTLRNAPYPGHVGVMYDEENIMSSNSSNGKWEMNYTLDKWKARWASVGFPIYFYRLKENE